MPWMRGTRFVRAFDSRNLEATLLYLLVGVGFTILGWQAAGRFRADPLERLVFGGRDPDEGRTWTVAFIFAPIECPSRMELVERLNQVGDHRISVRGFMLVDQRRFPGWREVVAANHITFPVWSVPPGSARSALRALGTLPTPVLAVYDQQRRLRLVTDLARDRSLDALLREIAERAAQPVRPTEGPA
jgi:hypothetical protein